MLQVFSSLSPVPVSARSLFTLSNSLSFLEFYTSVMWVERFAHAQKELFNDNDLIII